MLKPTITIFLSLLNFVMYAQGKNINKIINEAKKLYRSEMASWYGTDLFAENFKEKRAMAGGYFSYDQGDRTICVFYSNDLKPKIISSFSFDSTYNPLTAQIDGNERGLTKREQDLLVIRNIALKELRTDTLFKFYKGMNPNLIPLIDENGRRVYILTGPTQPGIVVLGNDYLLTFDKKNRLKQKKRLHQGIFVYNFSDTTDGKEIISTIHTHSPESGRLISATDICTLMLYARFIQWKSHLVLSDKTVSIWDVTKQKLITLTREAWERISEYQGLPKD